MWYNPTTDVNARYTYDGTSYYWIDVSGPTISSTSSGSGSGAIYTRTSFTATASQTTFSVTYTAGAVHVYVNGVLLNAADYTASNGTSVVLTTGCSSGDVVEIVAFTTGSISIGTSRTVTDFIATASQTTFSVVYTPNFIDVYRNGVKLAVADYTATNGTSVVLANTCTTGDLVETIAYSPSLINNTTSYGIIWQSVQTGNFTAISGYGYPVNTTSGAITVTLPASPSAGNFVTIVDYAGTSATNNITVAGNGSNIQGSSNNGLITVNRQACNFVYIDSTQGWISYAQEYSSAYQPYTASYLVIAGGGGGGYIQGGGGGAGGLLSSTTTLTPATTYSFVIGAGGVGSTVSGTSGVNGVNTTAFGLTAIGGGGVGSANYPSAGAGSNGGSGGGGSPGSTAGTGTNAGTGTSGQGNNGGQFYTDAASYGLGGGGGGAGAVGSNAVILGPTGNGGIGVASSITGTSTYYAGGGGGGGDNRATNPASGSGGNGGGGAGGNTATAGTANTGGGGGAGAYNAGNNNGAAGGSGVVILSVPTASYSGTTTGSPTITTSGSNTIIKYTSSGSYTA
jgi:hypothetical protein